MNHQIFTLLIFLFFTNLNLYSQENKKPHYLYDETWNRLTLKEYINKQDLRFNLPVEVENDTAVIARLVPRKSYGILKPSVKKDFLKMLSEISKRDIDSFKTIVINFHFEKNNSIEYYTSNNQYNKKMDRSKWIEQFYFTESGYQFESKHSDVFQDKFKVIEKLFFKDYFQGDNYVIIKPDGKFFRYYGEYQLSKVYQHATSKMDEIITSHQNLEYSHKKSDTIYSSNLVAINNKSKRRYFELVPFHFNNNGQNYNGNKGDFFNIKVKRFNTLNMSCSFWAEHGDKKNVLRVLIRLAGDSDRKLTESTISAYSSKVGQLVPIKTNFPDTGPYAAFCLVKKLDIDKPEEMVNILKNDVVTVQIDDQLFEFVAPDFD
ncbi:MAG: hypothetical protein HKO01_03415 [Flaviramulus sp.]|nr:hypothetical protein [Flaviramulus sp.]NNC49564.1 hypothetical protein [Flaviramulus sp.]